jgi:hypothetical protein
MDEQAEINNINKKIEELELTFNKYRFSQNKKEIIRGLIEDK